MSMDSDHLSITAQTPAAQLANLSLSRDPLVRAAVARHPNTSPYILGTLAAQFPAEVLGNPALPLLRLANPRFLLGWPTPAWLALLRQPDAPAWLRRLARMLDKTEIHVAVASHPKLMALEAEELAAHPAWLVRARIAARPDLSPALLQRLRHDPDDSVRLAVACREKLADAERAALLADPSRYVRQAALRARRGS